MTGEERNAQAAMHWQVAIGHMKAALAVYSGAAITQSPSLSQNRHQLINVMLDAEAAGSRCLS